MENSSRESTIRTLILGLLIPWATCSEQASKSLPVETEPAAAQHKAATAAGVTWTTPSRWKPATPRPMRVATYIVPAVEDDPEDGECAVYFFGTGQGGSVEANLKRWVAQFEQPDGRASDKAAQQEKVQIAGLTVTKLSLSGTYLASGGPMSSVKEKKPNFRLLAAIVEAPGGLVFFKFTGPNKTVAAAETEFRDLLASLRHNGHQTRPPQQLTLSPTPPRAWETLPAGMIGVPLPPHGSGWQL